jgi:hypothetical protein
MQAQSNQVPLYKLLRTTAPARNWCINQPVSEWGYWTLDRCIEEASHFPTREQWEKESPVSYGKVLKRGWLTKCTTHIKGFRRKSAVPSKWTKERCIEAGRRCQKRTEFKKRFNYVYERARQQGWLDVCCAHMI